jgi:8-oxo-dGTP pyrophosphatase MutT (NUDIX family)
MNPYEIVDLVDVHGAVTLRGLTRGEIHAQKQELVERGLYQPIVIVVVVDDDGNVFAHERGISKGADGGGELDHVCGVVAAGETWADAAMREAKEEYGVELRGLTWVLSGVNMYQRHRTLAVARPIGVPRVVDSHEVANIIHGLPEHFNKWARDGMSFVRGFFTDMQAALDVVGRHGPHNSPPSDADEAPTIRLGRSRLRDLETQVRALRLDRSVQAQDRAAALAVRIGHRDSVRHLLRELMEHDELLEVIARRSFHHTNHFDKIVLVDGVGTECRVAIHLWRPPFSREEFEDEQIHDHRCDFWSTVLFGVVRSQEFVRNAAGQPFAEVRYKPERSRSGRKRNLYRPVGTALLCLDAEVEHSAGIMYHHPWNRIHRIAIADEPTASILLRGPYRTNETSIFSNSRRYDAVDLSPLEPDDLRVALADIVGRLS